MPDALLVCHAKQHLACNSRREGSDRCRLQGKVELNRLPALELWREHVSLWNIMLLSACLCRWPAPGNADITAWCLEVCSELASWPQCYAHLVKFKYKHTLCAGCHVTLEFVLRSDVDHLVLITISGFNYRKLF